MNVQAALDSGIITEEIPLEKIYTNQFIRDDLDYSEVEAMADAIDIEAISARYPAD